MSGSQLIGTAAHVAAVGGQIIDRVVSHFGSIVKAHHSPGVNRECFNPPASRWFPAASYPRPFICLDSRRQPRWHQVFRVIFRLLHVDNVSSAARISRGKVEIINPYYFVGIGPQA
jgi:hypothetical protein